MSYEERLGVGRYAVTDRKEGIEEKEERGGEKGGERRENRKKGGTRLAKELKRAYYRKSLLWHPDR
jgi:hypothetical protein